jgi:two-component system cell cycle response regulator
MSSPAPDATGIPKRLRTVIRAAGLALAGLLALHVVHAFTGFGGSRVDAMIDTGVYDGVLVASAVLCVMRGAFVRESRLGWLTLGAGLLLWASGDVYWSIAVEGTPSEDVATLADVGWTAFYPACYLAIVVIARSRVRVAGMSLWVDGAIGALGVFALGAAVVLPTVLPDAEGLDALTLAVNGAYPVFDLVLLGLVIGVFGITGWRPDRTWLLLGCGFAAAAVADGWYLYSLAQDSYAAGGPIDSVWMLALLLMAAAAWQPTTQAPPAAHVEDQRTIVLPVAFCAIAVGLETYDHFTRISLAAQLLATATLVAALVRMLLTFRERQSLLVESRRESLTDALTGLGNRRLLIGDLDRALERGDDAGTLVLFDLDGFKAYNDTFGHPAGDALLARLGHKLDRALRGYGRAYRIGGDEFCVLIDGNASPQLVREHALECLREEGRGFSVSSSHGSVALSDEADTSAQALQIADQRLYRHKAIGRRSPRTQARDVLMRMLSERHPDLHHHMRTVARLAQAIGARLGLGVEELDETVRGAELHDIGKMAVPDAILDKPGPLDEAEWSFIRRHTLIGEGILGVAPALAPIAQLVRSSHERFDGRGYPDGLGGEEIPLGSRIIFVCDAYDAMTSDRAYAPAMSREDAIDQLRRGSGGQFDPRVVDALCDTLAAGELDQKPAAGVDELPITPSMADRASRTD